MKWKWFKRCWIIKCVLTQYQYLTFKCHDYHQYLTPYQNIYDTFFVTDLCHFVFCPQILKGLEMESRMHIRFLDVDTTTMRCGKSTSWRSSCEEMFMLLLFLAELVLKWNEAKHFRYALKYFQMEANDYRPTKHCNCTFL